ncbi:unnamed protein product [Periconia digitata]|uniref:Uncharacterized protein n=1 Tax=Periconia digitata TaxID=1303443 RepID=A0A9W4UMV3_9PLEO|nr:unnamed protein product [Periconia digitata]
MAAISILSQSPTTECCIIIHVLHSLWMCFVDSPNTYTMSWMPQHVHHIGLATIDRNVFVQRI